MQEKILNILNEIKDDVDFSASESFFQDGSLTSIDIIMLISELNDAFEITIPAVEIIPNNFCNIAAISALVSKLIDT